MLPFAVLLAVSLSFVRSVRLTALRVRLTLRHALTLHMNLTLRLALHHLRL